MNVGGQPRGAVFAPDGSMYITDPSSATVISATLDGKTRIVLDNYEEKSFKVESS